VALLVSTAGESQPSVSPDGHRIAFASGDVDNDIVEISLNGQSVRSLLATSLNERGPAWSPSGVQYAYTANASGRLQIWLRSTREEGATPLAQPDAFPSSFDFANLQFSPDGRRIAYDLYDTRHRIAISSLAAGTPVFPDQQSTDHHGPSWSPDGNWIAYRRLNGSNWELVKRPLGGGEAVKLDDAIEGGSPTAWSPTGEWICHSVRTGLHLVSPDGARRLEILTAGAGAFGFSPDGKTVYTLRRNPSRHWELAAFSLPGGAPAKVVPVDLSSAALISGFSMNPDGKSFITSVGKARFDLWLLDGFDQP
jgi:Tol biopolymer transport system component